MRLEHNAVNAYGHASGAYAHQQALDEGMKRVNSA